MQVEYAAFDLLSELVDFGSLFLEILCPMGLLFANLLYLSLHTLDRILKRALGLLYIFTLSGQLIAPFLKDLGLVDVLPFFVAMGG